MRAELKRAAAMARLALMLETTSCLSNAGWTRGSNCSGRSERKKQEVGIRTTYADDSPVLHIKLDLFDIFKVWYWRNVVHGDLYWLAGILRLFIVVENLTR